MEKKSHPPLEEVQALHSALQKLIGLHRQLMDIVRQEKEALIQADLLRIREATGSKQALIESIKQTETERLRVVGELALRWKRPVRELTLTEIAIFVQGEDLKAAEQLRSDFNALSILIKRVSEQNQENHVLVAKSLEHINAMKKNVLGEANPAAQTYAPNGKRQAGAPGARLISREA